MDSRIIHIFLCSVRIQKPSFPLGPGFLHSSLPCNIWTAELSIYSCARSEYKNPLFHWAPAFCIPPSLVIYGQQNYPYIPALGRNTKTLFSIGPRLFAFLP